MTPTTHEFLSSDGVSLAWREVGEGRPIVLLHGLFSDSFVNWVKFGTAERIAREGYRVIAPDLRAHGMSGKPHEPEHYPQLILVRDLKELIEHLGLTDFDLGGFSLGARTTIEAVLGGLRPKRSILAGTGLDVLTNWERRSHFYVHAIDMFGQVSRGDPHWLAIQFMKTRYPEHIMRTLRSLVFRAAPNTRELSLIRAMAIEVVNFINRTRRKG